MRTELVDINFAGGGACRSPATRSRERKSTGVAGRKRGGNESTGREKAMMNTLTAAWLAACLISLPAVNAYAHESPPFTVLSRSIAAATKHRALPEFSFVERSGKKVTLEDLRGKVWIADFIYTHCPDTCPMQSADMAKLQDRWRTQDGVKLVSFSVDPERDTPQALSEYAKRFRADATSWLFLTGNKTEIARLVEDGFRLMLSPAAHGNTRVIVHSSRFALIDQQGKVNGYYDARDPKALQRLADDVTRLLQQPALVRNH